MKFDKRGNGKEVVAGAFACGWGRCTEGDLELVGEEGGDATLRAIISFLF